MSSLLFSLIILLCFKGLLVSTTENPDEFSALQYVPFMRVGDTPLDNKVSDCEVIQHQYSRGYIMLREYLERMTGCGKKAKMRNIDGIAKSAVALSPDEKNIKGIEESTRDAIMYPKSIILPAAALRVTINRDSSLKHNSLQETNNNKSVYKPSQSTDKQKLVSGYKYTYTGWSPGRQTNQQQQLSGQQTHQQQQQLPRQQTHQQQQLSRQQTQHKIFGQKGHKQQGATGQHYQNKLAGQRHFQQILPGQPQQMFTGQQTNQQQHIQRQQQQILPGQQIHPHPSQTQPMLPVRQTTHQQNLQTTTKQKQTATKQQMIGQQRQLPGTQQHWLLGQQNQQWQQHQRIGQQHTQQYYTPYHTQTQTQTNKWYSKRPTANIQGGYLPIYPTAVPNYKANYQRYLYNYQLYNNAVRAARVRARSKQVESDGIRAVTRTYNPLLKPKKPFSAISQADENITINHGKQLPEYQKPLPVYNKMIATNEINHLKTPVKMFAQGSKLSETERLPTAHVIQRIPHLMNKDVAGVPLFIKPTKPRWKNVYGFKSQKAVNPWKQWRNKANFGMNTFAPTTSLPQHHFNTNIPLKSAGLQLVRQGGMKGPQVAQQYFIVPQVEPEAGKMTLPATPFNNKNNNANTGKLPLNMYAANPSMNPKMIYPNEFNNAIKTPLNGKLLYPNAFNNAVKTPLNSKLLYPNAFNNAVKTPLNSYTLNPNAFNNAVKSPLNGKIMGINTAVKTPLFTTPLDQVGTPLEKLNQFSADPNTGSPSGKTLAEAAVHSDNIINKLDSALGKLDLASPGKVVHVNTSKGTNLLNKTKNNFQALREKIMHSTDPVFLRNLLKIIRHFTGHGDTGSVRTISRSHIPFPPNASYDELSNEIVTSLKNIVQNDTSGNETKALVGSPTLGTKLPKITLNDDSTSGMTEGAISTEGSASELSGDLRVQEESASEEIAPTVTDSNDKKANIPKPLDLARLRFDLDNGNNI